MNIKSIDTVGRYDGEEFMIILQDINLTKLKKVAEKLLRLIKSSYVTVKIRIYPQQYLL